jgi:hypothetical protein
MQTNNAHEYTNEQLQLAIDAAFPAGALADCGFGLDNFPNQNCCEDEATNRLAAKDWNVSVNVVNNADGSRTVNAINGLTS